MKCFKVMFAIVFLSYMVSVNPLWCDSAAANMEGAGTRENPYVIPEAASHVKIDGKLEEECWKNALMLELLYESWPGDNTPAPVKTECYLAYDRSNLYVGFRAFDPEPAKIRAFYFDRDNIWYDDFVLIFLDTFNDERRAYGFRSNPLGVQADDIRNREAVSVGWDGIYHSAGHIYDWGYSVEMAIPFNQLRFQQTKREQVWGINLRRLYPRNSLCHIDFIKTDRSNNCFMCQFVKIKGFENVRPGRNVEIVPSLTFSRTDRRKDFPGGDFEKLDQDVDPGITAIWGFTPGMTLSAAVNPDFSQVEADSLQLDINEPFALFYEERRPFFTEGTDFFNTNLSAVYTRTMRDPSWGFKIAGKEKGNTIGAYVLRDTLTNLIFPGSRSSGSTSLTTSNISSVLRYKRDFGKNYTLGILATDREGDDYFNRLLGIDTDFRFSRKDRLRMQFMGSNTRYPGEVAREFGQDEGAFGGTALDLRYTHDTRHLDFSAIYQDLSKGFRADLGYMPQVNYRYGEANASYTWIGRPGNKNNRGTWYQQLNLLGKFFYSEDHEGDLISNGGQLQFTYDGPWQSEIITQVSMRRENYNFSEFDQLSFMLYGSMKPNRRIEMFITAIYGDRIDYDNTRLGQRLRLNPEIILKPGRHMRLLFSHIYERLNVEPGRLYTANISQLTAVYHLNVRAFFRAILQYVNYNFNAANYTYPVNPQVKRLLSQLLFSYEINPRTVLYLGYSDNYRGSRDFALTQYDRSFFAKISYDWSL